MVPGEATAWAPQPAVLRGPTYSLQSSPPLGLAFGPVLPCFDTAMMNLHLRRDFGTVPDNVHAVRNGAGWHGGKALEVPANIKPSSQFAVAPKGKLAHLKCHHAQTKRNFRQKWEESHVGCNVRGRRPGKVEWHRARREPTGPAAHRCPRGRRQVGPG